jgi:hypothetical protein
MCLADFHCSFSHICSNPNGDSYLHSPPDRGQSYLHGDRNAHQFSYGDTKHTSSGTANFYADPGTNGYGTSATSAY